MRKITKDMGIERNYGQPLSENDTLILNENAEIEEMKKELLAKKRVLKVKGALYPYIREGSQIAAYDASRNRYKLRLPQPLRRDDQIWFTGATEQEVYDKVYLYLFGDDKYTLRTLFIIPQSERSFLISKVGTT